MVGSFIDEDELIQFPNWDNRMSVMLSSYNILSFRNQGLRAEKEKNKNTSGMLDLCLP